jgi:hypothetical protein
VLHLRLLLQLRQWSLLVALYVPLVEVWDQVVLPLYPLLRLWFFRLWYFQERVPAVLSVTWRLEQVLRRLPPLRL